MKRLLFAALFLLPLGCDHNDQPASSSRSTAAAPAAGGAVSSADRASGAPSGAGQGTTVTSETSATTSRTVGEGNAAPDRTNTGINARDRDNAAAKTPGDQNENQADINTTAEIRKRVVGEKFSTNGHNVKIVTQNGKVTLRGPVDSDQEKRRIEEIAKEVAGAGNVDNQLEVNVK